MPIINSTYGSPGRFGNQFFHNIAAHIIARKEDLKFVYQDYERMRRLGIDLFIDGKNTFPESDTVYLDDSNFMEFIKHPFLCSKNIILDSYKQTREFCLFLREYFYQNRLFEQIIAKNKHHIRYQQNNDVYLHVRLGDKMDSIGIGVPGFDYYDAALTRIGSFKTGYISSDSINHPICQQLIAKYGLRPYNSNEIDTIFFASTCSTIILSTGTFSWLIGFLAQFSSVYYPKITHPWHGDIFVFDDWIEIA